MVSFCDFAQGRHPTISVPYQKVVANHKSLGPIALYLENDSIALYLGRIYLYLSFGFSYFHSIV